MECSICKKEVNLAESAAIFVHHWFVTCTKCKSLVRDYIKMLQNDHIGMESQNDHGLPGFGHHQTKAAIDELGMIFEVIDGNN